MTALAALILAVPAAEAQKVNKDALLAKIEKSDSDIADAKKGAKAATWINRGKAFYEAAAEPTKSLFVGMDATMLKLAVGDAQSTGTETVNAPRWRPGLSVVHGLHRGRQGEDLEADAVRLRGCRGKGCRGLQQGIRARSQERIEGQGRLEADQRLLLAGRNAGLDSGDYLGAADAYAQAFEAQSSPAYGEAADPSLLYYAGYLHTVDGANNPASFPVGAEQLSKAIDMGYTDEEGNIYYYLFHCYYGQKASDKAFVDKAKQALLTGIEKFPKNERILDGLVQLYTSPEDNVGDPADLIALIDKAIENNPTNVDLWFGRGRIFYALKDYDQSIESFKKVVELKPDLYEGNYYLGVFYTIKGDEVNKEMNAKQYSSQAAYDADLKEVNAIYMEAIPWLEKALELKPEDPSSVELLKSICFRLRDEEGMMDKYTKYNEMYRRVQGQQ